MAKRPDISDQDLALRAQEGDLAAEEELLRRYKGLARKKAKMYFIVGADEEDVMQEGMIGLLKAVRRYDGEKEASFSTFAGLCVTNQIISAIRAADRNKHRILNTSLSLEETVPGGNQDTSGGEIRLGDTLADPSAPTPDQLLVIKDIAECIVGNDDRIFSDYEMEALTLLLRGRSRQQIGEELGRSEKSVDNCLNRVRKKILNYLSS
ncbi:MAG: sigma-70 family RNA polymerase sigma factor [Firmicutes bacterium]|nr:sigma-70 family RNA polymerase sigma factor [Bacillota bacterium]